MTYRMLHDIITTETYFSNTTPEEGEYGIIIIRTGINIKWYNMCETETPEVEDTGQGREYQSG